MSNNEEFDTWLHVTNKAFVEATSAALDFDAMLATVMRRADTDPGLLQPDQSRGYPDSQVDTLADIRHTGTVSRRQCSDSPFATPRARYGIAVAGSAVDVLVDSAVDSDRAAVDGVLRWVRPLVVRYCRAHIGRQEKTFASADDVAQEVCLAVLTALPSYHDQGRPFLAFVYGIAAHKVADAHRSAARNRVEPVYEISDAPSLADGPEQRAIQGEFAERMTALLSTLPDRQREIIILRVVVGLSAEETADAIGSTPGAVRVAQHRALGRLRKVLTQEGAV